MRSKEMLCGLLAILAMVIYMLACGSRPAWSLDSKRVVFGFYNSVNKTGGLALYNLERQELKTIYQPEGEVLLQPIWLGKKEAVVALAARSDDVLDIIQVDLPEGEAKVLKSISAKPPLTALLVPPILMAERYLCFSARTTDEENSSPEVLRFDLQTNELLTVLDSSEHSLLQTGQESFYRTPVEDGIEIGTFDTETMKFKKLFVLGEQREHLSMSISIPDLANGPVGIGLGAKDDGSEFVLGYRGQAFSGNPPMDKGLHGYLNILMVNRKGEVLKKLQVPCDPTAVPGDQIIYGPKGQSLWIPLVPLVSQRAPQGVQGDKDPKECKLSLLEINIEDQSSKVVIEAVVEGEVGIAMQPSISPDGKWLAVDVLISKDQTSSVLYLIDLSTPERKVTKIALPAKADEPSEPEQPKQAE